MNTPAAVLLLAATVAVAIGAHTTPRPPRATPPPVPGCCHCPADACNCGPVCRCHLAAETHATPGQ